MLERPRSHPRRGRAAGNLLLAASSVVVFFALAEVAVRATGHVERHLVPAALPGETGAGAPAHDGGKGHAKVRYRIVGTGPDRGGARKREAPPDAAPQTRLDFLQYHPEASWELVPGFRATLSDLAINHAGLRGEELPEPRPAGERWVLLMGDSVTFGWAVDQEETYAAQLEAMGAACGGRKLRVLDAGVPGYAIAQGETVLPGRLALGPDVVVLCFGNVDRLEMEGRAGRVEAPLALAGARPLQRVLARSHFYLALRYGILSASARLRGRGVPSREGILAAYRERLARMVSLASAGGREVILLAQPHESDGNRPFNEIAADLARASGARYVDVPARFHDASQRRALLLSECHPTPEGHRLIAEALAEALGCS